MHRSQPNTKRHRPIVVSTVIVGALACTDLMSGPDHGSHDFAGDIRAEAAFSAVMTSQVEVNTPRGRYSSPVSRRNVRITTNAKGRSTITTSSLADPFLSEPASPGLFLLPNVVLQSSARPRGLDTTLAISRRIDGKKHRVLLTQAGANQQSRRPLRVVRFVDEKLVDAMELTEARIGDRWVVTKARYTVFDTAGKAARITARYELSDVQTASAKSRIMRQGADVIHALGSAFLPTLLHAEDDTSLDGPCFQLFMYATGLSASAAAASAAYAAMIAYCTASPADVGTCAQLPQMHEAMLDAIAYAAEAWRAYRAACTNNRPPPPPTPDTSTSGTGGGIMCYWLIWYYEDTGEIIDVVPLGCY